METADKFFSTLMQSRDIAHAIHLQTNSYAKHQALGNYYDEIIELTDTLIEMFQGKYGIITIQIETAQATDPIVHLTELAKYIDDNKNILFKDSWILNQIDTISGLIYSTLYKIKNLS